MATTADSKVFENSFFEEELRDRRLVVKRCVRCEHAQYPALPRCPACGSWEFRDQQIRETGSVYSWIRVHRPELVTPDTVDLLPIVIITVDMDDGVRLFSRYLGAADPVVGERVRGIFSDRLGRTDIVFEVAQ